MPYSILIVDDSLLARTALRRTLRDEAGTILEAPDGQSALALLASRHVDLVLTDIDMPVMNGLELTRRMRSTPALRDIPIVVLSSEDDPLVLAQLRQIGVRHCLHKPCNAAQLHTAITTALAALTMP